MMKKMRSVWSAGLVAMVAGIVLATARSGTARPEYTRRTRKDCVFCHPPGGYTLNDAGRYYRDHRTLDGFKPKPSD